MTRRNKPEAGAGPGQDGTPPRAFRRPGARPLTALLALISLALGTNVHPAARPSSARRGEALDPCRAFTCDEGGIIRGRLDKKELALVFTGGDFSDGGAHIRGVLKTHGVKAGFFFTGDSYRSPANRDLVLGLAADGHYLGPHSDKHLLYCDWNDRAKTLVTREEFARDLRANQAAMKGLGLPPEKALLFIPPYEWFNREIAGWASEIGLRLFNFTPGTTSNADYTTPSMAGYLDSRTIFDNILAYERKDPHGLNGFILLVHIGADPARTDKFYLRLGPLLDALSSRGYRFVRIDELIGSE